jgi:serpin B
MPSKAPTGAVVDGMAQFGYDLYRQIAVPGKNVVLSPLSLATAWGMLRAGAAGETAAQLDRVFGFPHQGTHEALNVLTRRLVTIDGPPPTASASASAGPATKPAAPLVGVANGLFVQNGFQIKDGYLHTLAAQYGAGMNSVDFTSPQAKEVIDAWVKEHTANRITKLFDHIPAGALLVLANAVYFKGDWRLPFDAATPAPFTRADGSIVQVPMMQVKTDDLKYAFVDGWQAVELPYQGSDLSMLVMIPTNGTDPSALLDPGVLADVRAKLHFQGIHLSMPRWNFGTTIELLGPLQKLGLTSLNDLSGISDGGLSIKQAIHRANITVDEHGTEAAAVTGIEADSAPAEVRADRPFVFAIVHKPSRTPLFIGQVADPTAS